jgi:hypothetical protein
LDQTLTLPKSTKDVFDQDINLLNKKEKDVLKKNKELTLRWKATQNFLGFFKFFFLSATEDEQDLSLL